VILLAIFGIPPYRMGTNRSRDPEGTRKQKMDKLTPAGSQYDAYSTEREVETQFDTNFGRVAKQSDRRDSVVVESDEEVTSEAGPQPPVRSRVNTGKRAASDVSRPAKRRDVTGNGIREAIDIEEN
jgi:hypothetical protein